MKYLFLLLSLISQAFSSNLSKAEKSFVQDLTPYKKTLTRDIFTYTWFESSDLKDQGKESFLELLNWYRSAWDAKLDDSGAWFGPGLYAAVDPIISKSYGDTMLKLTLRKGMSFLDLRENDWHDAFPISFNTIKLFLMEDCDLSEETGFNDMGVMKEVRIRFGSKKRFFSKSKKCHDSLLRVFKHMKINFFAYFWGDSSKLYIDPKQDERPRDDKSTAFVITDYLLTPDNTEFFDKKYSDKDYRCHYDYLKESPEVVAQRIFGANICFYQEDDYDYTFNASSYINNIDPYKYPGTKTSSR